MITIHANGYLGFDEASVNIHSIITSSRLECALECQDVRKWYTRTNDCFIKFGPTFQSLTEIRSGKEKKVRKAVGKTKFKSFASSLDFGNPLHPVLIDAALQLGWFASVAGRIDELEGKVPISIETIRMRIPDRDDHEESLMAFGTCDVVGFQKILTEAELRVPGDGPLVTM